MNKSVDGNQTALHSEITLSVKYCDHKGGSEISETVLFNIEVKCKKKSSDKEHKHLETPKQQ